MADDDATVTEADASDEPLLHAPVCASIRNFFFGQHFLHPGANRGRCDHSFPSAWLCEKHSIERIQKVEAAADHSEYSK